MRTLSRSLLILSLLIACTMAWADGFMVPVHQPEINAFSVKYHHVDVAIDGQAATTKVDQIFHNETAREEEGTYIFPLPKDAVIHRFSMFVGEVEQQGKIMGRDEARKLYESIVRQRKDPALLEYVDRNTFRARVFPIPANGDKRIKLEYTELVGKAGNLCRYVYPLGTERFSAKPLEDVRVTIRLKSKTAISNIYSPSHVVKIDQTDPTSATVTWQAKDVKPDTDLVLYYSLADRDVAFDVLTFRDKNKKGYFMLLASPKVAETKPLPKTIIFVFDRTGSMAGEKIDQAKAALKFCLNSLKPQDHFSVISFNETPDVLATGVMSANKQSVRKALDYVDKLEASGNTDLNEAIKTAMKKADTRDYSWENSGTYIVLLTDGLPTAGEQNIDVILKNAKAANKSKARVFTFGVGYDVNAHLLDLLTEQSNGLPAYVLPNESIEAQVSGFFSKVSEPVLTDLKIAASGVKISQMYPSDPLPDLFKGSQLVILGRYDGQGRAKFTLTGKSAKGVTTLATSINMPAVDKERDFIPQIWAARRIGYLLDQVRLHKSDDLIKEIVMLSKDWGIPTEFTSFFVDEPVMTEDAVNRAHKSMAKAGSVQSGTWGVTQSMNNNALKTQAQVSASPSAVPMAPAGQGAGASSGPRLGNSRAYFDQEGNVVAVNQIQNIGTRTFYQRGRTWVDSQVEDQKSIKNIQIKQFSNAHFKLLAAYPELNKYQKLGSMRIYVNGQSLEIGDQGKEELTDAEIKAIIGTAESNAGSPVSANPSMPGRFAAGMGIAGVLALAARAKFV